jgi:precorrin-6A/cobalt-precorrin-6A reductase
MPVRTVLLLGGTREAATLAERLATRTGLRVITSLAGRTREPRPLAGETRIGGFGGTDGLAQFIRQEGVDIVIDATHPFARQISANARGAAGITGVRLLAFTRPPWDAVAGDRWIQAASLTEAADALPAGAHVLLAIGSQHLAAFAHRNDVAFVVRMIDPPGTPPPLRHHTLVLARPSQHAEEEAHLLTAQSITHIVARNSGGPGAYAKIEAARTLGLPVIMIDRPAGETNSGAAMFFEIEALLAAL